MSDSRHDTREFPVHHGQWPAHAQGAPLLTRPEHAEAAAAAAAAAEGDGEQAEPKKAAAPRAPRGKAAAKDASGE